MNMFYCNGKEGMCYGCGSCAGCPHRDGAGGEYVKVPSMKWFFLMYIRRPFMLLLKSIRGKKKGTE